MKSRRQYGVELTLDVVRKRWMQDIDDLLEAVRGVLPSLLVKNEDLDAPFAHREALLHGRLVAKSPC